MSFTLPADEAVMITAQRAKAEVNDAKFLLRDIRDNLGTVQDQLLARDAIMKLREAAELINRIGTGEPVVASGVAAAGSLT